MAFQGFGAPPQNASPGTPQQASILLRRLLYIAVSMITGFLGLMTLVLRHVDDPTLAAPGLIAIGAILLATIAVLNHTRPWEHRAGMLPPQRSSAP